MKEFLVSMSTFKMEAVQIIMTLSILLCICLFIIACLLMFIQGLDLENMGYRQRDNKLILKGGEL